jgi:YYY domain-containing protein
MLRRRTLLLFLLALILRLLLQGWDVGVTSSSSHPDERQVGFVTERAEGWFDDPNFYAYGSLHFQAIRLTATILGLGNELRGIIVSGRAISLLASMLAIALGWLVARRAWGPRTGDLFIFLAAWVPLDLQQSHFTTVEAHHSGWVMAALAACFWLARSGRPVSAAATGAAIGASLAVKVASLALGLPLLVAVVIGARGRGFLEAVRLLAISGATGIAFFWLCQPWAFAHGRPPFSIILTSVAVALLIQQARRRPTGARSALLAAAAVIAFIALLQLVALAGIGPDMVVNLLSTITLAGTALNPSYIEGVGNEIAMVAGTADVAYVRIYAHTISILYPLRELAVWGWGAFLLLATIAGSAAGSWRLLGRWRRWIDRRWTDSSILLVVMLAWLVPMAVRLSTLQVKFLRYWEPLVVPAALIAAWWLMRLPRKVRRHSIVAVAVGTAVWGLAYTWSFIEPHPHRTAAEWIAPMLADQQVVAFEHWDEHIALDPEKGTIDRVELPSYELPEEDEKIETWTANLARADWVILTSNRVYRTVLANPDRFDQTARLYRLLLSGEAGFEVLTRVRRGPRLFGLRWPVQRADESFLNYEFPQVVILRRVADTDPQALAEKVNRPLPFLESMGYADLEDRWLKPVPTVPPVPTIPRQIFDLMIWMAVFTGFGLSVWVFLLPVLRGWPDAGIGLALATGWIVPSWTLWMGSELHIWDVSPATATWISLLLLAAGTVAAVKRWPAITSVLHRRRSAIVTVLVVTAAVGALFLVVRAWNPAIYWGEKPMDFSFLNAFMRAPHWPPGEPWMAGMPLHYYYFGEVLAAFPMLVAGCSPAVGYNLISATIPAIFAGVLAGLGLLLTRRRLVAAASVLPLLVILTGNLAWPWLIQTWRDGNIFDLWWATSRVIPGFAIDEYPLWTSLFADLHGHFIAFPVLLATFAWGWLCVTAADRRWMVSATLCGISAAAVVATNPWDLFILTTTLGFGVLAAARRPMRGLLRLAVAGAISILAAAPFIVELLAGFSAGAGERGLFVTRQEFAPAWAILRHFGLFLVPLTVLSLVILGRRFWIVLPTAGIGVLAGLSFQSTAAALGLAATAVFLTVAIRTRDRLDRLGWSMAALGALAVAACERFTLIDRMNTIFKVYNGVWVLLAFALATALLRNRGRRLRVLVAVWAPLQLVAFINLPLGIAQGWMVPRITSPRPTLDGQAFLESQDPQTWFLVRALQGVARPGAPVAEAAGHYYSDFTRITMHTGQPTVVGWDWHLKQRGQPHDEIMARFSDLELLYSGGNRQKRRAVLDRYQVEWAVAARVERERYEISDEDLLGDIPGVHVTAQRDGAVLYRVLPAQKVGGESAMAEARPPPGMTPVGRLTDESEEIVRSIALGDDGATAILRGGTLVELDLDARRDRQLSNPNCEPMSVERRRDERWVACGDGSIWRLAGDRWLSQGRQSGAEHLVADENVWFWGAGGLWQLQGESNWQQFFSSRVTAAASNGGRIAWSEGSRVWVSEGDEPRKVGDGFEDVRALAWQGDVLWALDNAGLHRAGSVDLPWRTVVNRSESVLTITGSSSALWLVRKDGFIFQPDRPFCPSPWTTQGATGAGALREPRGLAVSEDGWFVVADTFNHRLLWYTDQGRCLDSVGTEGDGPREFREPSGVALSGDGTLAVADTWNGRIQVLRPNGVTEVFGRNLFGPRDLMWAADGSLIVSDTGNRKLLRFTPPDWEDETVARLPGPPVGLAWAGGLIAVAVPEDGALLLVDGSSGEIVRRIELRCWNTGDQQEGYLALLPSGYLAVSSPHYGELWIVDPTEDDGQRLLHDGLDGVTSIALTPDGDLLASLTWEHRLVKVPVDD